MVSGRVLMGLLSTFSSSSTYFSSKKRRRVFVIFLDLKNAFGEVHHSLIRFASGNTMFLTKQRT